LRTDSTSFWSPAPHSLKRFGRRSGLRVRLSSAIESSLLRIGCLLNAYSREDRWLFQSSANGIYSIKWTQPVKMILDLSIPLTYSFSLDDISSFVDKLGPRKNQNSEEFIILINPHQPLPFTITCEQISHGHKIDTIFGTTNTRVIDLGRYKK